MVQCRAQQLQVDAPRVAIYPADLFMRTAFESAPRKTEFKEACAPVPTPSSPILHSIRSPNPLCKSPSSFAMPFSHSVSMAAVILTLISTAAAQAAILQNPSPACLFNKTHCSCRNMDNPGTCLRHESGNTCLVGTCSSSGFSCDCEGTEMCMFSECRAWVSNDGTASSELSKGGRVECKLDSSVTCLRRVGEEEVEAPEPELPEYRMVQFGAGSERTMFNMSGFPFTMYLVIAGGRVRGEFADLQKAKAELGRFEAGAKTPSRLVAQVVDGKVMGDPHWVGGENQGAGLGAGFNKFWWNWGDINRLVRIGQEYVDRPNFQYNMHGKWMNVATLLPRYITLRMYDESAGAGRMLCGIYNKYGIDDDGLGTMRVHAKIRARSGQRLEWVACDDVGECKGGNGTELNGMHTLVSRLSDGWCVKPLDWSGNVVGVEFSEVDGMKGVVLQSTAGREEKFDFGGGDGMVGKLDKNGLVRGGRTPEILFNLKGIEVPF